MKSLLGKKNTALVSLLLLLMMFFISSCGEEDTQEPTAPFGDDMAFIQGGSFKMGSPANEQDRESDETQNTVNVADFYMAKYEVTNADYVAFLNSVLTPEAGWLSTQNGGDHSADSNSRITEIFGVYTVDAGYGNYPVTSVSW